MSQSHSVVINEILYDAQGDANRDGHISPSGDQFIELVNISDGALAIGGWSLSNRAGVIFTFPEGTVIPTRGAFVVFADEPTGSGFGGAYLFSAGTLNLNTDGDTIFLHNADGITVTSTTYDGAVGKESIVRSPEETGPFRSHSSVRSGRGSLFFSPGTRADGSPFGSAFATGLRGGEGWRLISSPVRDTRFNDMFGNFWTQGMPGSDVPTGAGSLYEWEFGTQNNFSPIGDMSDMMQPGRGYAIYVYEDNDYRTPGMQGGFPKVIRSDKEENQSTVRVAVKSEDVDKNGKINQQEGFNLLGNPFAVNISAHAVIEALQAVDSRVNANLYVWEASAGAGNGRFAVVDGSEKSEATITPFQAFFVRYTGDEISGTVRFDRSRLSQNKNAYPETRVETKGENNLELTLGDGNQFDVYQIHFQENGQVGEDQYDGYKLFSLNENALNLFSTLAEETRLAKNILPPLSSMKGGEERRIALGYDVPRRNDYTFSWQLPDRLPEDFQLYLIDNETGQQIDMRTRDAYKTTLSLNENRSQSSFSGQERARPTLSKYNINGKSDRFELRIVRMQKEVKQAEPLKKDVVLSPNYPNPFNAQTQMDLDLQEKMHVRVTVWNIVGQKVATMKDEVMDAGRDHPLIWNVPANMPSGIYICKVEAGGSVITRKMTLVK